MEATRRFFRSILLTSLVCLTFGEVAQAQLCNPPACWPGKFYKFDVVAKTGDVTAAGTITGFGDQPSINDKGTIAFVGQIGAGNFEGVFTQDLQLAPVWISQGFSSSGRKFGRAVQINNVLQIVARDSISGAPPPSLVRIWQGNASGLFTTIARGGFATDPFASVFAQPAINNGGQVVFSALDQNLSSLLATPNSALHPPYNEIFLNTPLRPVIDDNGFVVVRNGSLDTNPIVRYDNSLVNLASVADTTTDFNKVGMSPGVSRDGGMVAFTGDMSAAGAALWGTNPGPGVFIAIIQNNAAVRIIRVAGFSAAAPVAGASCTAAVGVLGAKCVEDMNAFPPPAGTNWDGFCDPGETCKAVGEIEDNPPAAAGGAPVPVYFKTFDPAQFAASSAEWQQRIGVIHTDFGVPGLDGDTIVVSFIATPNVASALNLFSANSGLWTVQVDLKLVGGSIVPKIHKPMPVLQVGDKLGSATTVTAISVFDPIAAATVDEVGVARVPVPGDHEVAFWVSTSANTQMILRGTHEDTDGDDLLDHWEEFGIDFDGDGTIDLNLATLDPAAPPNFRHKDLYVEVDYMCTGAISADASSCAVGAGQHTHQPGMNPYTGNALAVAVLPIARTIAAFNAAPVVNPDGATGINLHVQVDEAIPEVANMLWNAPATTAGSFQSIKRGAGPCTGHFGTVTERADANCVNILGARSLAVRYDIFGDQFNGAANSGVAKLRGNDFIVTLAVAPADPNPCTKNDFANWAQCLANTWGTTIDAEWADLQASTFMHEGGHALGLFHGGDNLFANFKPNYLSIMNYSFQFNAVGFATFNMAAPDCKVISGNSRCRTNRTLDYSRGPALANLNEAALNEAAGIGAAAGTRTLWYIPNGANFAPLIGFGSGALDWNFDGMIGASPARDLNKSGGIEVLTGHDDWSNLTYGFHDSPELSLGAQLTLPVVPEPDITDYQALTAPTVAPAAPAAVPNVVGLTQAAATTAIQNAGLVLGTVTTASSNTVAAGNVISENPAAGTSVAPGSAVNLVVSSGPAPASVPNVVGLTQAAATSAIQNAGLVLGTVTTASSNTVAAGNVISENPAAGTSVAPGSAVNLVVSSGPAPVSVPNVVGLTQAAATSAIQNAGLVLGTVTTASSNTVAAGNVISENPAAGTSVAPGSAVNLVVSSGPAPASVPNVVGLTQAAATTAIQNAGLVLGTVTTASSNTVAAGNVISENPAAGTSVALGSAVNLVVSSGPAPVAVPNVVGLTQAAATSAIQNAGLVLGTVTTASSNTVAAGNVISENPAAGTSVALGSAVNLVVSSGPAPVAVPNVVGLTQAAATSAIQNAGLVLGTVTTASSNTVAAGNVISENPAAGTSVAPGSAVNLVVSSGPAPVAVPNVVGLTQAAATTAIQNAGLVLGTVTTASSNTVAAGNVISENPAAGTSVALGSAVNLVVSSGPAPVAVPNVVGLTQAAATSAIQNAGLVLGTVTTASSNTVAAGNVISENPAAGTSVAPGSAVNLVVSSGPAPVAVPNVVGLTQAAATSAIQNAGLVLGTVTTASSNTVAAGNVISENPAAGTSVALGSAVNLVVSSGPAPVSVPNVVGLTQAAATSAIQNASLVLGTVTTASSNTVAAGNVISENPAAGTSVAPGSAVNLVVSSGPAPVAVPNVVGLTQAAATSAIQNAGLVLGTVTTASSNTVAAGNVISENPAAGTSVAPGSAVNLVVSSGPALSCVNNLGGRGTPSGTAPARIDLTWTGMSNVASYNMYRSPTAGGPSTLIGNSIVPAFSDTGGLTNGSTYYYVLRAVDQSGSEVCHSNQATITIPSLPR